MFDIIFNYLKKKKEKKHQDTATHRKQDFYTASFSSLYSASNSFDVSKDGAKKVLFRHEEMEKNHKVAIMLWNDQYASG